MPRYPLQGISALSQLTIDADKDWNGKGISNLKELAAAMVQGDMVVRGAGGVLVRLPPGVANTVLTSSGPGAIPAWGPGGLYLNRYIPAIIAMAAPTLTKKTPEHTNNEPAPLSTSHHQNYLDDVANYIKRLTPAVTITNAQSIVTPDHNNDEPAAIGSTAGAQLLVAGGVADDGGAETDETAAARNTTANDMTLLPAAPAVGDAYYLGSTYPAHRYWINIGTAGAGNWTLTAKYWDGGAWQNCVDEIETSAQFMSSGLKYWQHTPQVGWATKIIQGMDLYWMKIECTNFVNCVTQPLGTQAWAELLI